MRTRFRPGKRGARGQGGRTGRPVRLVRLRNCLLCCLLGPAAGQADHADNYAHATCPRLVALIVLVRIAGRAEPTTTTRRRARATEPCVRLAGAFALPATSLKSGPPFTRVW